MSHNEKAHAMRALEEEFVANNITATLAAQANNIVMGDGNLDADIFFIGEAPGRDEDKAGLPFVGAAGKFLNEMLQAASIERSDVYIANTVKYRPPKNRDPKKEEVAESWPYLLRQIEIVQPKVIITLGRISMNHFLPDAIIGDIHGQPQKVLIGNKELTLIPLYHPSAATYNRELRPVLIEDMMKVPGIIKTFKV